MNSQMRDVTFTARDGQVTHLDTVYIRGSKIKYELLCFTGAIEFCVVLCLCCVFVLCVCVVFVLCCVL